MPRKMHVLGVFPDEHKALTAIEGLKGSRWTLERVHSPLPSYKIFETLKLKKSPVGYFTLAGGIVGFFAGLVLAIYTVSQWHLITSGKPIVAWIPFFIVAFEFTILFSVFGNILGFLLQSRLPDFQGLNRYDPRCSEDHFGVLATCDEGEQKSLTDFFQKRGGESRIFE